MKIVRVSSIAVGATLATARTAVAEVFASTNYENADCTSPVYVSISPTCDAYSPATCGESVTGMASSCVTNQTEFLESVFGASPYVLVESYSDAKCESIMSVDAYVIDGKCHEFAEYGGATHARITTLNENGDVTSKGSFDNGCASSYSFPTYYDLPLTSFNTGDCVADGSSGSKWYAVGVKQTSAGTPSTGTTPTTTTTASSGSTDANSTITPSATTAATTGSSAAAPVSCLASAVTMLASVVLLAVTTL